MKNIMVVYLLQDYIYLSEIVYFFSKLRRSGHDKCPMLIKRHLKYLLSQTSMRPRELAFIRFICTTKINFRKKNN